MCNIILSTRINLKSYIKFYVNLNFGKGGIKIILIIVIGNVLKFNLRNKYIIFHVHRLRKSFCCTD